MLVEQSDNLCRAARQPSLQGFCTAVRKAAGLRVDITRDWSQLFIMPHTNRARRADHYRSLDNNSNYSNHDDRSSSSNGHQLHQNQEGNYDTTEGYTGGDGGGRSARGRFGGSDVSRGRFDGGTGERGRGHGGDSDRKGTGREDGGRGQRKSGKKRPPSAKNQIRSLTRLMNKPVREGRCGTSGDILVPHCNLLYTVLLYYYMSAVEHSCWCGVISCVRRSFT